jgi:hypothetical protein
MQSSCRTKRLPSRQRAQSWMLLYARNSRHEALGSPCTSPSGLVHGEVHVPGPEICCRLATSLQPVIASFAQLRLPAFASAEAM